METPERNGLGLQKMLEEQGYVVLCTRRNDVRVGDVISGFNINWHDKVDASVVVIDFASRADAIEQWRRFDGGEPFDDYGAVAYVKVVAE